MEAIRVTLILIAGVAALKIYFEIFDAVKTSKNNLFSYKEFVDWEEIILLSIILILCIGLAFL